MSTFGMGTLLGLGGSASPIFTTGGLFSYWTADNAITSGGLITSLPDQSGNGQAARNLTKVTTGPTYNSSDSNFNGYPSISGTTSNVRMQSTFDTSLAQPSTVYLVMKQFSTASTMFWRTNAGNNTNGVSMIVNSGPGTIFIATLDSANAITSSGSLSATNYVSCCVYNSAGVSGIFLNNSQTAFATSPGQGTVDTNNCAVITIGSFGTAISYSWASMACFNGAHTAAQRLKIMSYLGNRYAIAVS